MKDFIVIVKYPEKTHKITVKCFEQALRCAEHYYKAKRKYKLNIIIAIFQGDESIYYC